MLQTDNKVILLWGNSLLAERTARGIVRIGIVATVTVGDMDVAVEPIWDTSCERNRRRVTGEIMTISAAQLTTNLSCFGAKSDNKFRITKGSFTSALEG